MLKIRLQRVGRAHEPSFRLVLTDSDNSTKSGRFKEVLGNYDPRKTIEAFKPERIQHWLSLGALATPTVHNLLVRKGIVRGKKIHVGSDVVVKEAAPEAAPEPVVEAAPEVAPEAETAPETVVAEMEAPAEAVEEVAPEAPAPEEAPSVTIEEPVVVAEETPIPEAPAEVPPTE